MCRVQCVLVMALFVGLVQAWDVALTIGDRIEFYTEDGTKTATVHLNSQNLTALAYDEVHNMLLYVDKQSAKDKICGYNMTSWEYQCYIEIIGRNVRSLAFDPVTEILFFTDTKERSINWFSLNPGSRNNFLGNLLIKMEDGIPTDIAVDSCGGYIYWINTNLTTSTIERARFNGSDREIVISAEYKLDLHSLAISQRTQKMYWVMPETISKTHIYSADLNGKNKESINKFYYKAGDILSFTHPNTITASKQNLFLMVDWCSPCVPPRSVWAKDLTAATDTSAKKLFPVHTESFVGIAANYKMKEQFQGMLNCNHVHNNYETNDSFKIEAHYIGPYCVHGIKRTLNGQSDCKCTPGYTGTRCDVPVCENYCFQGNCSFTEEGLPKCRCNAGYSGERCEVNMCNGYCLNNGTCSLNGDSEPVCQCQGDYLGYRCEVSACENYCLQGNCSFNRNGMPKCRCHAGYSGERCEMNMCNGYCFNNGTCSLNEEDEPVCECIGEYEGQRCDVQLCLSKGGGSPNEVVETACQCADSHDSSRDIPDKNKTTSTTSTHYSSEGNLKISVVVEVKSNN